MNSLVDSALLQSDSLLEAARQLALSGGLPAATAGLQAAHGLDEQAAADVTAAAFGLASIRLSDLPEHALALSLASFAEFLRRQVLLIDTEAACLVVTPNPLDTALRDWLESLLPLTRRIDWRLAPASVVTAYLAREESRGGHARTDFSVRDDARFLAHTMAYYTGGRPRLDYKPVTITAWKPVERKY